MDLPAWLRLAIDDHLRAFRPVDLTHAAQALSTRYRETASRTGSPLIHSPVDVAAYAAVRLPATYAAISAALRTVEHVCPSLKPRSLLDIGGGPGTATWAALQVWPSISQVTVLERNAGMIALGEEFAATSVEAALQHIRWDQVDITAPWTAPSADLSILAYMLGELPSDARAPVTLRAWNMTTHVCVIIEPGTPAGYGHVREAGRALVRAGAHIVAPAPLDWPCLESESDWLHFSARVPRTRLHRSLKAAELSYEDEKYAYIAASRAPYASLGAVVARLPQVRGGHIRLVLCTPEGLCEVVVARSHRAAYRLARALNWGSTLTPSERDLLLSGPSN